MEHRALAMFKIHIGLSVICLFLCAVTTAVEDDDTDSDYDTELNRAYFNPLHRTDLIEHVLNRRQPDEKTLANDDILYRVKRGWIRRSVRRVGGWFRRTARSIKCGWRKLFGIVRCYCSSCPTPPPPVISESLDPPEFEYCPSNMQKEAASGERAVVVTWDEQRILDNVKDDNGVKSKELTSPDGVHSGYAFKEGDHIITYTAINTQNLRGYCTFSIKIIVYECPRIVHPTNGYISFPDTQLSEIPVLGERAQATCLDGYSLGGSTIRTCQASGSWSGAIATCTVIECAEPVLPPTAELRECSLVNNYQFQSTCIYDCVEGYSRADDAVMAITCRGVDGWDGELQDCIDLTSPEITNCPTDSTVILERNSNLAEATWIPPNAIDIIDGAIIVELTGQIPNSMFPIGQHRIRYDAVDSSGNQAIPCIFFVTVIELTCPPIVPSYKMQIECSGFGFGSACNFTCVPGYPIQGSSVATCELTGGDPPDVFWDYGADEVPVCTYFECVDIEPPINGASACNSWTYGRFCIMLCQNEWDIPRTAPNDGEWTCSDDTGIWIPTEAFPGCTERRNPERMVMDSSLYFSGTCGDNEDAIKDLYIEKLFGSNYPQYCTNHPECAVENVVVSCGTTSPFLAHSRFFSNITYTTDAFTTGVLITFRFAIVIAYTIDWTPADIFDELDAQFVDMATQLEAEIAGGLLDMPEYGLTADPTSFAYDWSQLDCEHGLVASDSSFSCRMCPTGTMYDEITLNCVNCPKGTYQNETGAFSCKPCPEDTSTFNNGSSNISLCKDMCLPGSFSASGIQPCIPCPINEYQDLYGSTTCLECPDNSTTGGQGSSNESDCKLQGKCDNNPCNGHTCYEDEHGFNCVCDIGFEGSTCETEKDPCEKRPCLNGGTCLSDGRCQCPNNTLGAHCQVLKEDGGFSEWEPWTDCSATCENGQQSRIRECNNPVPGYGGRPCDGDFEQTRTCNMGPCPFCDESDLEIPNHSSLNCSVNFDRQKVCHVECYLGYMLISTIYNTVTCDVTTRWEFDFDKDRHHLPSCVESKVPETLSVKNSFTVKDVETGATALSTSEAHQDIYNFVASNTLCLPNGTCTVSTEIIQKPSSSKREAVSDVSVTFTVEIGFENATYFNNDTFDEGSAYNSIEQLIAATFDLESMASEFNASLNNETFGITLGGAVYFPNSDSLQQTSAEACEDPQVSFSGFCVNCPPGSYKYGELCRMCPLGQYQSEEGQMECDICPLETTTGFEGARNMSQCFSIHQEICSPGTYSEGSLCIRCPIGQYQDTEGQLNCIDCPRGQYQDLPGQASCLVCGEDETTNQTRSTQKEDCFYDPMICPVGSYETVVECTFCPVGYYQDLPNQHNCKLCPRGYTTHGVGSISVQECVESETEDDDATSASILMVALLSCAVVAIVAIVAIVVLAKGKIMKRNVQVTPRPRFEEQNAMDGKRANQKVESDAPPSYENVQQD